MNEIWKDIKGYEGLYQVSNLGRVKSFYNGEERVLVGWKNKGYLRVELHKEGEVDKKYLVHRLVAEAFIPNPDGLPCVNHKDECKTNNIVTNLEYCDVAYNNDYGTRNERIRKTLGKPVYQYTIDGEFIAIFLSTTEASQQTGCNGSCISKCCRGVLDKHKGYIWSYTPLIPKGQLF